MKTAALLSLLLALSAQAAAPPARREEAKGPPEREENQPAPERPALQERIRQFLNAAGRSRRPRNPRPAVNQRKAKTLMEQMRGIAGALLTPLGGGFDVRSSGPWRPAPPAGRRAARAAVPPRFMRPTAKVPGPARAPSRAAAKPRFADRLTQAGFERLRSARAESPEGWAGVRKFGKEALGYGALAAGSIVENAPGWLRGAARWAAERSARAPRRGLVDPAADLSDLRRGADFAGRDAKSIGRAAVGTVKGIIDDFKRAGSAIKKLDTQPNSYTALTALALTGVAFMDVNPAGWGKAGLAKTASKDALKNLEVAAANRAAMNLASSATSGSRSAPALKGLDEAVQASRLLRSPDFQVIKAMDGFPEQRSAMVEELARHRVPAELAPGVARRLEAALPPVPKQGQVIHLTRGEELLARLEREAKGLSTPQWDGSVRIPNDARISYKHVFDPDHQARYASWADEARKNGARVRGDFGPFARDAGLKPARVQLADAPRLMAETGQPVIFRLKEGAGPRAIVVGDPFETPLGTAFAFQDPGREGTHYISAKKLGELADGPGTVYARR